jgi:Putative member of DMT superfamily (DUF486)
MTTIVLLTISNIFMTFAWYGHLKCRQAPLFKVIVISWGIAFFEYCFQVPANRIGSYEFSAVTTEDHPGNNHLDRVLGVLRALPGRTNPVELYCGLRADRGGGVCDFQEVVMFVPFALGLAGCGGTGQSHYGKFEQAWPLFLCHRHGGFRDSVLGPSLYGWTGARTSLESRRFSLGILYGSFASHCCSGYCNREEGALGRDVAGTRSPAAGTVGLCAETGGASSRSRPVD